MIKNNIVIASVLKPVDDSRMFEKFAISLGQTNKYRINIIGFFSKKNNARPNVIFHPLFRFGHLNLKRVIAPFSFLKKLVVLKPDLVIITTYELIIPAILYKCFTKTPLIYDIMENHYRNILYQGNYPRYLGAIVAFLTRTLEYISSPLIDHYFLAECGYTKELKFIKNKYTVIQNKFPERLLNKFSFSSSQDTKKFRFIYSGTIAKNYGIFKTLEVYFNLAKFFSNSELVIVGHAPDEKIRKQLIGKNKNKENIKLITSETPLPYSDIIKEIKQANCGLVTYYIDKSNENCFPTKIYEYMASQLPFIITSHHYWVSYCQKWDACIPINLTNNNYQQIAQLLQNKEFFKYGLPKEIFWETEKPKLIKVIDQYLVINH